MPVYAGTYAVQSVVFNETAAMLEVVCVFAPNTEAIGCEVAIVRLSNEEVVGRMRGNRTGNSAVMIFLRVLADVYRLDVFEVEENGLLIQALTELVQLSAQLPSSENRVSLTSLAVLQITTSSNFICEYKYITVYNRHTGYGRARSSFYMHLIVYCVYNYNENMNAMYYYFCLNKH